MDAINKCKEITLRVLLVSGPSANAIVDKQSKQDLPFRYLYAFVQRKLQRLLAVPNRAMQQLIIFP
jgi:Trm5-related predicted tRNA methylase